ncbi:hypothetical protein LQ564_00630 [Massilia sp. G4R7]|uniref:Lipoprotein n=1 Tax=Massilia phyllostachyos TaxID=2898585 RepID=A0ABS8PZ94_9BURK|nr:hypothetical protein [Massilia phyllostachyos]MCD2514815.1 hypothetical protein [Massilia phyllostachyos]
MKSSYLRAGAALACALALSACGGSDGNMVVGGSYYGVTKPGLVLTNGGDELVIAPSNTGSGNFAFGKLVETDDKYDVKVKPGNIPSNASGCEVLNGAGRVIYDVTNISVVCTLKQHELKGTVSGLTGANLVLVNGSDKVAVPAGATSFTMAKISEDAPYGITVLTQPDNQTCTVANGSGTMGANDVTNVAVTCGPRT